MTLQGIRCEILAEDALLLRFGERIDIAINDAVLAAAARLQQALPQLECVPAYASLLLRFDPLAWQGRAASPHEHVQAAVHAALEATGAVVAAPRVVEIPVCYGGGFGPDLDALAAHAGLDAATTIALHAGGDYRVAMLGFAPGFPYLLGLDQRLAMPRRVDPRQRVPAGSVAIGGGQTGIYPAELPGGWQLIGRTPLRLFDPDATTPARLQPGDRVRFRPIDAGTFDRPAGTTPA
jgi:KipI family sensor histidine kinase inhibitor